MKKFVFVSIIIPVLLCSCDETFLDQEKPLVSTEAMIYTDAARTEMALFGLYGTLKGADLFGGRTYIAFDVLGDDFINLDPNGVTLYNTYIMQVESTTQENLAAWAPAYLVINRANVFLESLEAYNTAEVIGNDLAKRYIAEAKFVRALTYYYLVSMYSEPYKLNKAAKAIPLRLTAIKENGHSDKACATNAKIYETILSDLADITALPNDAKVKTRATQAAANMLKMRVYMAMENWPSAITAGEAITGYSLVDDVAAQWSAPFTTDESIYSFPHASTDRPGTQRAPWEYYYNGRILILDEVNGVMSYPNYSLAKDKRVDKLIDVDGKDDKILLKFPDRLNWTPIFRFAETKLNLAECYAQNNRVEDARTALSDVRRRSIALADDPIDISTLSGADLLGAISLEKRLEFLGEGMRGLEIRRKGETFFKTGSLTGEVTVAPGSQFYYWPLPEDERVNNSLWNQLEP